jgi:hypothetical protein
VIPEDVGEQLIGNGFVAFALELVHEPSHERQTRRSTRRVGIKANSNNSGYR